MQQTPWLGRIGSFVASQTARILKVVGGGRASARHLTGPKRNDPGTKKGGYVPPGTLLFVTSHCHFFPVE
jgi:hypothetical protein